MCIVVAKGALPNESGTHDDAADAARPVARSVGGVSLCVCKNNLQYAKGERCVVLLCVASRRFSSCSHHLWYAAGAVTPAALTTVQVAVTYGGRLLRFSFGQRKYKMWKTQSVIYMYVLYDLRTFLLFEHPTFCSLV